MKITAITLQTRDKNRVNVFVDGKYRFSLDVFQVGDLGIKTGRDYSEEELLALETESQFGKVYARALEYCLMRPHSAKEVRDYLYRKTLPRKRLAVTSPKSKVHNPKPSVVVEKPGIAKEIAERVYQRLLDKGYINDEAFTRYWVEYRSVKKGASRRKLQAELRAKGVDSAIIERHLAESGRSDSKEIQKVIAKKAARYPDRQKLARYLARQGFGYDDIRAAIQEYDEPGYD